MFDPFGDFGTMGYLRNIEKLKDLDEVKVQEHLFFVANLESALDHLAPENSPHITYQSFLDVHKILFDQFYPWAGVDRDMLGIGKHVGKGDGIVEFEQADRSRLAVEWGLKMGVDKNLMRRKPGTIMGAFAWGHPFLDGNGRTMLLIHTELCDRAGIAIDWASSRKDSYLQALTEELWDPDKGLLDGYFQPLIRSVDSRVGRLERIMAVQGLDGSSGVDQNVVYQSNDPQGQFRYDEMKIARDRSLGT
ncbi:MAG: Fic family protein [Pseudomonadota bacterium]|nr:Fic family protein [Pseudomonadota bacterium]